MQTYKIPLVPGPVSVPEKLRAVYQIDYGSADLEEEFFSLYAECESKLKTVLGTRNQVAIQAARACWPSGAPSRASSGRVIGTWERLDAALRSHGMVVGGNYGPLAGKVFRIGHMGSQANMPLVQQGMDVLDQVLRPRASG